VVVPWADKANQMMRGMPLPVARDEMVRSSLADPSITHILMVDSDMIPEDPADVNECLKRLFDVSEQFKAPVVSALYKAKQAHGFNNAAWVAAPPDAPKAAGDIPGFVHVNEFKGGNWFQVDVVGMGFCLFRREAFEKIPPPWFPWPDPHPSEDFNFCIKAKKYGVPINLFTAVKFSHTGTLILDTNGKITTLPI
jgi:hypothetical protein